MGVAHERSGASRLRSVVGHFLLHVASSRNRAGPARGTSPMTQDPGSTKVWLDLKAGRPKGVARGRRGVSPLRPIVGRFLLHRASSRTRASAGRGTSHLTQDPRGANKHI